MCKQRCEICQTEVRQLAVHVYQVHQTFLQDYRKKYGVRDSANLVYHKCGVCGKEMVFDYSNVGAHIRNLHKLSFKEYKEIKIRLYQTTLMNYFSLSFLLCICPSLFIFESVYLPVFSIFIYIYPSFLFKSKIVVYFDKC